jgi:hypothetical protein
VWPAPGLGALRDVLERMRRSPGILPRADNGSGMAELAGRSQTVVVTIGPHQG